jgi:hypothetical protein
LGDFEHCDALLLYAFVPGKDIHNPCRANYFHPRAVEQLGNFIVMPRARRNYFMSLFSWKSTTKKETCGDSPAAARRGRGFALIKPSRFGPSHRQLLRPKS